MVARSVVSLPRSLNCPPCSVARTSPERLSCRSARTSSQQGLGFGAQVTARPAAPQLMLPLALSWPPSRGAVRGCRCSRRCARLPRPPCSSSSVIVSRSPCSVARRRPSRRSTPSSSERTPNWSVASCPLQRGAARAGQARVGAGAAAHAPAGRRQRDHRPRSGSSARTLAASGRPRSRPSRPRRGSGGSGLRPARGRRVRCPRPAGRAARRRRRSA